MDIRTKQVQVFLVEDSALLRERVSAMLGAIPGAKVVGHAATADEALAGILSSKANTVVLDLHLAQGNGMAVLRALSKQAPQVAVYVLTNFPNEAYRRAALQLGARGFFDKTTEFELLRDALAADASGA